MYRRSAVLLSGLLSAALAAALLFTGRERRLALPAEAGRILVSRHAHTLTLLRKGQVLAYEKRQAWQVGLRRVINS